MISFNKTLRDSLLCRTAEEKFQLGLYIMRHFNIFIYLSYGNIQEYAKCSNVGQVFNSNLINSKIFGTMF